MFSFKKKNFLRQIRNESFARSRIRTNLRSTKFKILPTFHWIKLGKNQFWPKKKRCEEEKKEKLNSISRWARRWKKESNGWRRKKEDGKVECSKGDDEDLVGWRARWGDRSKMTRIRKSEIPCIKLKTRISPSVEKYFQIINHFGRFFSLISEGRSEFFSSLATPSCFQLFSFLEVEEDTLSRSLLLWKFYWVKGTKGWGFSQHPQVLNTTYFPLLVSLK